MACLRDLPAELILRIYEVLDPGSHLDFSLATKFIAWVAEDVLEYHRSCQTLGRSFGVRVDGRPSFKGTGPYQHVTSSLYQKLANDHIAAWHVENLDIKESYKVPEPIPDEPARRDEMVPKAETAMRAVVRQQMDPRLSDSANAIVRSVSQLSRHAKLEVQYALLCIAIAPRLKRLSIDLLDQRDIEDDTSSLLDLVGPAIYAQHVMNKEYGMEAERCLRSLKSIEHISFRGNFTRYGMERSTTLQQIVPFLLLPSARTVRITNTYGDWDETVGDPASAQSIFSHAFTNGQLEGCSNVETIIFEHANHSNDPRALSNFLRLPVNLKTVVFKDCRFSRFDHIVDILAARFDKLETLLFLGDGPRYEVRQQYGLPLYYPDCLAKMKALRIASIDILYVMPSGSRRSHIEELFGGESEKQFFKRFVNSFPPTLETLILEETAGQRLNDKEMDRLGRALVYLVAQRKCPNLTAIYGDNFEIHMWEKRCQWGAHTEGCWLTAAQAKLRKMNVTLYTQREQRSTDRFINSIYAKLGHEV